MLSMKDCCWINRVFSPTPRLPLFHILYQFNQIFNRFEYQVAVECCAYCGFLRQGRCKHRYRTYFAGRHIVDAKELLVLREVSNRMSDILQ